MTNARIADGASAPAGDSGSRIRQKNPSRPAPSTTAASSSSPGIARMNGRRMTIVIGSENAACGIATPSGFSSSPSSRSSRYSGSAADAEREQQAEREERVERLAALERVARQRERGHRAEPTARPVAITAISALLPRKRQNAGGGQTIALVVRPHHGLGQPAGRR